MFLVSIQGCDVVFLLKTSVNIVRYMYTGGGKITGAWGVTGDGEYRGLKVRIHFKEIQPRARFQSDMGTVTGGYFYSGLYEGVKKIVSFR